MELIYQAKALGLRQLTEELKEVPALLTRTAVRLHTVAQVVVGVAVARTAAVELADQIAGQMVVVQVGAIPLLRLNMGIRRRVEKEVVVVGTLQLQPLLFLAFRMVMPPLRWCQ